MKEANLSSIRSAKELTRYASEALQNDITRERSLEALGKRDKEYQRRRREICKTQGIQPPRYWRGLRYGWRYVECIAEALHMSEFERKRLEKALDNPIVGDNKEWKTLQDFKSDLGNDDKEAFTELKGLAQEIIVTRNKDMANENGREIKRNVFELRSKPREELDTEQIL